MVYFLILGIISIEETKKTGKLNARLIHFKK